MREPNLAPGEQAAIRRLLVLAFPQHADFFEHHSYWGAPPDFRLLGREPAGRLTAHLAFGCRLARVGQASVAIAGIGGVAVHPEWHGQGIGKAMFAELRGFLQRECLVDFGFLECREEVVGFYEKAGLQRVHQGVYRQDPDTGLWLTHHGPALVLPVRKPLSEWPQGEVINLQGLPW